MPVLMPIDVDWIVQQHVPIYIWSKWFIIFYEWLNVILLLNSCFKICLYTLFGRITILITIKNQLVSCKFTSSKLKKKMVNMCYWTHTKTFFLVPKLCMTKKGTYAGWELQKDIHSLHVKMGHMSNSLKYCFYLFSYNGNILWFLKIPYGI